MDPVHYYHPDYQEYLESDTWKLPVSKYTGPRVLCGSSTETPRSGSPKHPSKDVTCEACILLALAYRAANDRGGPVSGE